MKPILVTRTFRGAQITAQALCLPGGTQITLWGGTLPHIGAVSVVDPEGAVSTVSFPKHKDSVVSGQWARRLGAEEIRPAVVSAGIHYDALSREEIAEVVALTQEMLAEILEEIRNAQSAFV